MAILNISQSSLGLMALLATFSSFSIDVASAQTSSEIVDKLKAPPRGRTRSIVATPPPDTSVFDRVIKRGTRGITVEERKEIAEVARARPSIDMEVPFDYDSASITPRAEPSLKALGEALAHPDLNADRFLLAGHTDAKGTAEYNRGLSERRAEAVKKFLVERYAINADRLLAIGYGFEILKLAADPLAGANRRVQVSNVGTSAPVSTPISDGASVPRTVTRSLARQQIDGALDEIASTRKTPGEAPSERVHGDVNIELVPGTLVRLGQLLSVRITSRIAGTLIVYEEDAAGQVTQIFPNSLSSGSGPGEARTTIAAGETIMVPGPTDRFQLRVTPPTGSSRIIAIVVPTRVKVDDLTSPNSGLKPIREPVAIFQTLANRTTRGVQVEPSERATGVRAYSISE